MDLRERIEKAVTEAWLEDYEDVDIDALAMKCARMALESCPCHCVPSGHPGELLYRCTRCCHLRSLSTEGGRHG